MYSISNGGYRHFDTRSKLEELSAKGAFGVQEPILTTGIQRRASSVFITDTVNHSMVIKRDYLVRLWHSLAGGLPLLPPGTTCITYSARSACKQYAMSLTIEW